MYLTLLHPPRQKLEDTVASVEKQVKELIQVRWTLYPVCPHIADVVLVTKLWSCFQPDFQLPPFNKTFIANLQSLKNQMNETEWQVKPCTHIYMEATNTKLEINRI